MSRLTRDGTVEPASRDQILRRERGQGNIDFPCSADHEQDWQHYPVDPYSCYMCDHTYMYSCPGVEENVRNAFTFRSIGLKYSITSEKSNKTKRPV